MIKEKIVTMPGLLPHILKVTEIIIPILFDFTTVVQLYFTEIGSYLFHLSLYNGTINKPQIVNSLLV